MTVIAWHKEKGVAVDSRFSRGSVGVVANKWMLVDGVLLAGVGKASTIADIFDRIQKKKPVDFIGDSASVYVFQFESDDQPFKVSTLTPGKFPEDCAPVGDVVFDAFGSGTPHALAAMQKGMSPAEAVEFACANVPGCSAPVHVFDVRGVKQQ